MMREVAERLTTLATATQRGRTATKINRRGRRDRREILVKTRNDKEVEEAEEAIRFRLLRTEYPERDFALVDVIQRDCSKGRALEAWSRFRGIPPGAIMAIGDNYNDLDMLRFAGVPIVMGNSEEALKQEGWPVTLDCDSGGVARAVERYVLGNRE